ncbi:hypothetical protein [Streptomyces himalayensis]
MGDTTARNTPTQLPGLRARPMRTGSNSYSNQSVS